MVHDQSKLSFIQQLFLRRNVIALLVFLGFCNLYMIRANFSIAIVAMTYPYKVVDENGTTYYKKDFNWDYSQKGQILGSFYCGYILTRFIGGWLGTRFGTTIVFGTGVLIAEIITFLTPLAAQYGIHTLIASKVLEGLFQGVVLSSVPALWSRWAPPLERTRLWSFGMSGTSIGPMLASVFSGIISDELGWKWIFYISSIIGVAWCMIWFSFVRDNPENDPFITENELKYLRETLGNLKTQKIKHPWKKILTSTAVWATTFSHSCEIWGFFTLLTLLPSFLIDTLQFDVKSAGVVQLLPYLFSFFVYQINGIVTDKLLNKNIFTTGQVRKIFTVGACLCQTVFISLAAFSTSVLFTVLFIILIKGFESVALTALDVNFLDIAPKHASVLMGILCTFSSVPGILGPIITGYIVQKGTREEWKIVFCTVAIIYLTGGIVYLIFGSGEKQSWAVDDFDDKTEVK